MEKNVDRKDTVKKPGKNKGIMGLEPIWLQDLTPEEAYKERKIREIDSAHYTHEIRKSKTRKKIKTGVDKCLEEGIEITPKNISKLSGVSLATVYRHKDFIGDLSIR